MASEADIIQYYVNQAGSGMGSIYSGPMFQKGYGIGSFLGGLFRAVIPFFKSRGIAVGKQLLKTGANVLNDMQENQSFKNSLNNRKSGLLHNIKDSIITGKGYLRRSKAKLPQSRMVNRQNKTIKKKSKNKKLVKKDIFGY
jgi:hypothetical protein